MYSVIEKYTRALKHFRDDGISVPVLPSEMRQLISEFLALKEHCAALESREVCAVAHENVETCGYCQRDSLERLLKRGVVFALNCEFDPNQPLGFRQKAAAWLDAVSVAIGMGRPDDSCDHTWVDTGRCNKCGLAYEKWIKALR